MYVPAKAPYSLTLYFPALLNHTHRIEDNEHGNMALCTNPAETFPGEVHHHYTLLNAT